MRHTKAVLAKYSRSAAEFNHRGVRVNVRNIPPPPSIDLADDLTTDLIVGMVAIIVSAGLYGLHLTYREVRHHAWRQESGNMASMLERAKATGKPLTKAQQDRLARWFSGLDPAQQMDYVGYVLGEAVAAGVLTTKEAHDVISGEARDTVFKRIKNKMRGLWASVRQAMRFRKLEEPTPAQRQLNEEFNRDSDPVGDEIRLDKDKWPNKAQRTPEEMAEFLADEGATEPFCADCDGPLVDGVCPHCTAVQKEELQDILRRDGGWCVDCSLPLKNGVCPECGKRTANHVDAVLARYTKPASTRMEKVLARYEVSAGDTIMHRSFLQRMVKDAVRHGFKPCVLLEEDAGGSIYRHVAFIKNPGAWEPYKARTWAAAKAFGLFYSFDPDATDDNNRGILIYDQSEDDDWDDDDTEEEEDDDSEETVFVEGCQEVSEDDIIDMIEDVPRAVRGEIMERFGIFVGEMKEGSHEYSPSPSRSDGSIGRLLHSIDIL